jgi:K+-transporting ATPase KdpF subunit
MWPSWRATGAGGGVSGDDVVGLIIAVLLLGYLLYALLAPEKL